VNVDGERDSDLLQNWFVISFSYHMLAWR